MLSTISRLFIYYSSQTEFSFLYSNTHVYLHCPSSKYSHFFRFICIIIWIYFSFENNLYKCLSIFLYSNFYILLWLMSISAVVAMWMRTWNRVDVEYYSIYTYCIILLSTINAVHDLRVPIPLPSHRHLLRVIFSSVDSQYFFFFFFYFFFCSALPAFDIQRAFFLTPARDVVTVGGESSSTV